MTQLKSTLNRAAAAARLYGIPAGGTFGGAVSGGSHDLALANYYERRDATLRSDREGLELSRHERQQVAAFAAKHNIAPSALQEALSVVREYDLNPRSKEAQEAIRARTIETLRIELGSSEAAHKAAKDYVKLASELAKEVPSLAERCNVTGAGIDARLVKALAPYGDPPKPAEIESNTEDET